MSRALYTQLPSLRKALPAAPSVGILGAGVSWGLLGRESSQESLRLLNGELCEDRAPDTASSPRRRPSVDDGRWMNAQEGPGPSPSGTGSTSCTSHSAKRTLRSPGRIISFPQVCLCQHPGLYSGCCGHVGQPWLPAGDRPLAQALLQHRQS